MGGGWESAVEGEAGALSEDLTDGGVLPFFFLLQSCGSQIGLGQGGMLRRHAWPHARAWRSSGGLRRW